MATNDASFAPLDSLTKKTTGGAVDVAPGEILETTNQFDEKYETKRKELWAYYGYVDVISSADWGHTSSRSSL